MAPGGLGGGDSTAMFAQFLPLVLIFAIFWFLVIRR
jgi:preprotein translocase subunit YajC